MCRYAAERDRPDPVIVEGGLKLSLNHLVPPALGSVLKSVGVCVCASVWGVWELRSETWSLESESE